MSEAGDGIFSYSVNPMAMVGRHHRRDFQIHLDTR